MDPPAYFLSNNAQDQGKGQVDPDRPAAHVEYSTVYFHEQPVSMVPAWAQRRAPRSRGRRLWVRFIHWFMLYFVLVLFIFFTFKDLRNLSVAVRSLFLPGRSGQAAGDREVHLPSDCVEVVDWDTVDGSDDHHGFSHVAQTSLDLSVSSELLYLTSHGSLSRGTVQFVDTGARDADVSVDITFRYDEEDFSELLKVCRLHRERSKNGVGIFSPQWTHGRGYHRSRVDIVVKLPSSAEIHDLQTQLSNFAQDIGDFRDSVTFDSISLGSTNGHIVVKYLAANRTRLQTTNAHVSGVFNNTHRIEVHTTNGAVDGEFNLSRGEQAENTPAGGIVIKTTNGHIKADVSLAVAPESQARGFFNVDAETSNGGLDINFSKAPVLSLLTFKGRTTNAHATATLHETYEGSYSLSTSRSERIEVHVDDSKKDPAGKGRKRQVSRRVSKRGHIDGNIVWEEVGGKRSLGAVELTTTNGPVRLNL